MSKTAPYISVVIPHYAKNDNYLAQCLYSFSEQTYADFEVIVVDNGDTPSLLAIRLCDQDERFVYIYKKGAGMSGGRNYGVSIAKGKCICFCDSDDYVKKDFLLELVTLKLAFQVRIARVSFVRLAPSGIELSPHLDQCPRRDIKIYDDFMLFEDPLAPCGTLLDIELARANPFDTRHPWIGEDWLWSFEILLFEREIACSENCLYVYRDAPDSITKQYWNPKILPQRAASEQWRLHRQIILLKSFRKRLDSRFYEYYGNTMVQYLFSSIENKVELPSAWKKRCVGFIRQNRKEINRTYRAKMYMAFFAPRFANMLFKKFRNKFIKRGSYK